MNQRDFKLCGVTLAFWRAPVDFCGVAPVRTKAGI